MPIYDDSEIRNELFTYEYNSNQSFVESFKKLVKNIYIKSSFPIEGVEYLGINDNDFRKFLIMLKSGNKLATFIIDIDDLRNLKGQTIELLDKEEDLSFRNSTRVWVEFNNIDFPTKAEFTFLKLQPEIFFLKKAFNYLPITNTFNITAKTINFPAILKFYNLIENIYIVSPNGDTASDFSIDGVYFNQYAGDRKIYIIFKKEDKFYIFFTQKTIVSGSKKVRLESKENEAVGSNYECFIDFKNFDSYPTDEFSVQGLNFQLTDKAFTDNALVTAKKIEILESKIPTTTIVNASKQVSGNNAVQLAIDAITDATVSNRYEINVGAGYYEIHKAEDYLGNPTYTAMICPKDHIDVKGKGVESTIFHADLSESPTAPIENYQTMYNWADDVRISDLTLEAKGIRYVLHQDNANEANKTRYYDNVVFRFLGNGGYMRALGIGTSSGSKTYISGGSSESQVFPTFTVHNNTNFAKPSLWSFKNHAFKVLDNQKSIELYNSGSNQDCQILLENCSFEGGFILSYQEYWLYVSAVNDHFNHANWRVQGSKNQPFYFKNTVIGSTLCIETKSKTKNSKVRFDRNSSAYSFIIANPRMHFGNLGNPNRRIKDEYVIQDGANGLSGFAFGAKSILEQYYFPDNNSWTTQQDALGLRLGNCSTINKTLGITIDETNYNVVFNKDYTAFTNAQVLAEINAVIGSVATAKEYNIGADYYAELTDVVSVEINNSTTVIIPKGSLVSKVGSKVKICEEGEILYGLAIDDIAPYELDSDGVITSKGRIIKNCYVSLDSGNVSSAKYSGSGSRYKIVNGVFAADGNGEYRVFSGKYIKI